MALFPLPFFAALGRGLCAHGLALALEASVVIFLPLPPRVCAVLAVVIAVVVVETLVYFLLEGRHDGDA